jgi:arabinooligosaccharide transport system permease protein
MARGGQWTPARREALWGYLFILGPFVGLVLFGIGPLAASLVLSLFDYDLLTPAHWVGLGNFHQLLGGDALFRQTLGNTLFFLLGIPVGMALSLAVALALNEALWGRTWLRAAYFLPHVTSVVAVSLLWLWIFNPEFGLLNAALGGLGLSGPDWLQDPRWVKPALILMGIWGGVGQTMVIYLAGLQGVPAGLHEAAALDGAGTWARFRHVTWPALTPTTFFIAVMGVMGTFQMFGPIYLMTSGGPEFASSTLMYYLWQNAFEWNRMGYAAALAWLLGLAIMALTAGQFLLARRWVYYE